jgi:hypothetical protein
VTTNGFAGSASPQTDTEKVDSGTETGLEGKKENATKTLQHRWSWRRSIALGLALAAIMMGRISAAARHP